MNSRSRDSIRTLLLLLFIALGVGLLIDLLSGLPITRSTRSVMAWVARILGVGVLYIVGEMGASWISEKDQVTDPLPKWVLHHLVLLALIVAVTLGLTAVWRAVT